MGKISLTKQQEKNIIEHYLNGMSQKKSGELENVGYKVVQRILKENNIKIRKPEEKRTKFHVNDNFFKTQNREMAYILGLLGSVGCVASN